MTRLPSAERKRRVVEVMASMAAHARHRGDFTAAKVAIACGISKTMVYRLATGELQAYRAGLPGAPTDVVTAALRSNIIDLTAEVERGRRLGQEHANCPSTEDVVRVLERNELLEEENRSLRTQLEHLRRYPPTRPTLRSVDDPA